MSTNAGGAWKLLWQLLRSQKLHIVSRLAPLGLTPQLLHALDVMADGGMTMRELAVELSCDASNVTGIVDRLEERGLLVRTVSPEDRRVKRAVLTSEGKALLKRVERVLSAPPPAIAALSADDQRELCAILRRALANAAPPESRDATA